MNRRMRAVLAAATLGLLAGCTMPLATATAVDAAYEAVEADQRILAAYHEAVMQAFDQARAEHVAEAKRIAATLEAEGKLTPAAMQEGFDRLLAALNEIEARRARFQELHRLAGQNTANAKEALRMASEMAGRQAALRTRIHDIVTQAVTTRRDAP